MAKKTEKAELTLAEKAKRIAESRNVSVVYANSKEEFFTRKDLALLSVDGNKKKVQTFDFSNAADQVDETENTDGDEQ